MSTDSFAALEQELRDLAPAVKFDATPDLASYVVARISASDLSPPGQQRFVVRRVGPWQPLLRVAAAVIGIAAVFLAVSPGAREAVADVFRGVPGIRVILRQDSQPTPAPTQPSSAAATASLTPAATPASTSPVVSTTGSASPSPSASPSAMSPAAPSVEASLTGLGTPMTLAAARAAVPHPIVVPAGLGEPERVYFRPDVGAGMVTMEWLPRAGLPDTGNGSGALLSQFDLGEADDNFPFFLKGIAAPSEFRFVTVNGQDGGWVTGGHPLEFGVPGEGGRRQVLSSRLAANTLVWVQGGRTFRFESALDLAESLGMAASLR